MNTAFVQEAACLLFENVARAYGTGHCDEALIRYTTAYELTARRSYYIALSADRLEHKDEAVTV
jgi:hypothetical protein